MFFAPGCGGRGVIVWVEGRTNEMSDPRHLRSIKSGTANLLGRVNQWSTGCFAEKGKTWAADGGVGGIDQKKK